MTNVCVKIITFTGPTKNGVYASRVLKVETLREMEQYNFNEDDKFNKTY
jgi:hypothetical protein